MEFESARPSIVKSIKQRDLLNTWLRLYARARAIPSLAEYLAEYEPERLGDEMPDLVFYTVDTAPTPPHLTIDE